jgi:hypothetical protein
MKTLCIVNAPKDSGAVEDLKLHLTMSIRNGLIKLVDEVSGADIVAIMMSNRFLVDERAWAMSEEAKRKRNAGNCRVIPILIEHMAEFPDHLAMLQALPRTGKPAKDDAAWASVAQDIRTLAMAEG